METGSLAFLDVASCGEGATEEMPSWVPDWTREISRPAYDFTNRIKSDQARDVIQFTDSGKTLQLTGLPKGGVHTMQAVDLKLIQSTSWQGAFEKGLVRPRDMKYKLTCLLKHIDTISTQNPFPMSPEERNKKILSLVRLIEIYLDTGLVLFKTLLLDEGDTTIVYSYDVRVGKVGFLRVGQAAKGDQLVFVTGCFHYLVLRCQEHSTDRCKLVGLVLISHTT